MEWYLFRGFYTTKSSGKVQRMKCRACGRSFSARIFTLDYYAKRIDIDLKDLLFHYANGFNQRALSNHFHCATRTIAQKLQILSRQSMAAILEANSHLHIHEDLAIDGMQNFTGSQYQPNNYNIIVGQYSQYLSMVTQVIFRRGGTMTPAQKHMREKYDLIGHWTRKDFADSIKDLVDYLYKIIINRADEGRLTVCNSDKKPMYIRIINNHKGFKDLTEKKLFLQVLTSSRCYRNVQNPLFPVNYIDNRLRNDLADWQRETTSFPRESNRNFQRFICYAAYHDFFKPHRAHGDPRSHAEAAGLTQSLVEQIISNYFSQRKFHSKLSLPRQWDYCWFCNFVTPLMVRDGKTFNGNRAPVYLSQ